VTSQTRFVANGTDAAVLPALRELLDGADEALLCSAFVDHRGVLLLSRELRQLGDAARLVATSVFNGPRTLGALDDATALGVRCRIRNPARGTFHAKVAVARHGPDLVALVGSANLTSGLVVNDEAGTVLRGELRAVQQAAEGWWDNAVDLADVTQQREHDMLEPELWNLVRAHVQAGDAIETLSRPAPNQIVAVTRAGLAVETNRTRAQGTGPQRIEPRWVQLAWDVLQTEGHLSNDRLLNDLRVHRSSFVLALLAQLPGVEIKSRHPLVLRRSEAPAITQLAADEHGEFSP